MGIEIIIIITLLIFGVGLLLAEIFFLPGITVAGFMGVFSLIGAVIYAFMYVGETAGYITIGIAALSCAATFIFLVKSNAMNRVALKTDIEATVDQEELKSLQVGDKGITLSRLNPIGKAKFGDIVIEAKSVTGEYIDEDAKIQIVKIDFTNVVVQQID